MSKKPDRIWVRYIDVEPWKGPRHERLRKIWLAIRALYEQRKDDGVEVTRYRNRGKQSHAQCLQAIWNFVLGNKGYDSFLLITEMDFLPVLKNDNWLQRPFQEWRRPEYKIFAPVKQRAHKGDTETWFLIADMSRSYPEIVWEHEHDPGADLHEQTDVQHYEGRLGEGGEDDHLGWEYPWGVHLLGMRHLHDPRSLCIWEHNGIVLTAGGLQDNHDAYVTRWIEEQPDDFKELVT